MARKGAFILKNRLGQVVRYFRWESPEATVVLRYDTHRLDLVFSPRELEDIPHKVLAQANRSEVKKSPIQLGKLGSIEFTPHLDTMSPSYEIEEEREGNYREIIRWSALLHFAVLALILIGSYFLHHTKEVPEEHVVQIVKQPPPKKKKRLVLKASQKKVRRHKKKVVRKKSKHKVQGRYKRKTKSRVPGRQAAKKKKSLNQMGALGVLGSRNSKSQKAGGFNVRKLRNSRSGGSGGSTYGGQAKTFQGKGLIAASPGKGQKAQRVGGFGTRGRAGGNTGYGQHSLIGSSSGYTTPVDSAATVEGGLGRDQIAAVIRRHMGELSMCYESGLQVKPNLSGRVSVRFMINPRGRVSTAKVTRSSLRSNRVESCILKRLRSWNFPRPVGGVNVKVSYPFDLKRVGQG